MSTSTPTAPAALTTIEQRGIEPVPDERNGDPLQLLTAGDRSLASSSDPVEAICELLPTWMAVPYLVARRG